jgi:ubiquinone/menaquinone biosynthesis C-methylase UbiE
MSEAIKKVGAAAIRDKYRGRVAANYEKRRTWESKWKAEQETMDFFLGRIKPCAMALDIPVGTGRFLALYAKHGISAIGMDVSEDMLAQARAKGWTADLRLGDALKIELPDDSVDVAICVRFLNWLSADELRGVLGELGRVARIAVIVTVRLTERAVIKNTGLARIHSVAEFTEARRSAQLGISDVRLINRAKRGNYFMLSLHRHHETR